MLRGSPKEKLFIAIVAGLKQARKDHPEIDYQKLHSSIAKRVMGHILGSGVVMLKESEQ